MGWKRMQLSQKYVLCGYSGARVIFGLVHVSPCYVVNTLRLVIYALIYLTLQLCYEDKMNVGAKFFLLMIAIIELSLA